MGYVVAAWLFTVVLLGGYGASIALRRRAALAEAAEADDAATAAARPHPDA